MARIPWTTPDRIAASLLGVLICVAAVLVAAASTAPHPAATGTAHPTFSTMLHGGPGQARVAGLFWLGSLPVIGALFRHKEKVKDNTELMIFVTPTIYNSPEEITWDKMIDIASRLNEEQYIPVEQLDRRTEKDH